MRVENHCPADETKTTDQQQSTFGGRCYRVIKGVYSFLTSTIGIIITVALASLALVACYAHYAKQARKNKINPLQEANCAPAPGKAEVHPPLKIVKEVLPPLQRYKEESSDAIEADATLISQFEGLPLKVDLERDLIIFPDDYRGGLPLNGIKEIVHEEIKRIFPDLLFNIDGSPEFKETIKRLFKTLLSRPTGRALLIDLNTYYHLNKRFNLTIKELPQDDEEGPYLGRRNDSFTLWTTINNSKNITYNMTRNALGKKSAFRDSDPSLWAAVSLGHELIHFLHIISNTAKRGEPPTLHIHYTNLEEQQTITGWGKRLPALPNSTLEEELLLNNASQEEINFLFNEKAEADYDPVNENNMRAEFYMNHRTCHKGMDVPTYLKFDQVVSREMMDYIYDICEFSLEIDFENLLNLNKDIDFCSLSSVNIKSFPNRSFTYIVFRLILDRTSSESTERMLTLFMDKCKKINPSESNLLWNDVMKNKKLSEKAKISLFQSLGARTWLN